MLTTLSACNSSKRVAHGIDVGAQSTLGGARHFCPKNISEKLTKCPNFTRFLSEKLSKYTNFYDIGPKN